MAVKNAIASTVFAIREGKVYALTVQRTNTSKWKRQIMFGAGETIKEKEAPRQALMRGLEEELFLKPRDVKNVLAIGKAGPKGEEHLGYRGHFFLVEISFPRLERLVRAMREDPGRFHELANARVSALRGLGKRQAMLQPHYRDMLARIRQRLRKETLRKRR